jgi:hypothetical protein
MPPGRVLEAFAWRYQELLEIKQPRLEACLQDVSNRGMGGGTHFPKLMADIITLVVYD